MQSSRQRTTQSFSRRLVSNSVQSRKAVLAAVVAALASGGIAQAADFVYTPAGSTDNWSSGSNWSTTPVSATDTTLTFVGDNTTVLSTGGTSNNDIAGDFSLNILNLQGTGPGTGSALFVNLTGNALNLVANGGLDPTVNLNALNGAVALNYTVNNNLILANNVTFAGNGSSLFTFNGNFSGAGSLTKTGSSVLVLNGTNTYAGTTAVNGGTLRVAKPASLPGYNSAGQISVNGGTLSVVAGGTGWTSSDVTTLISNTTFGAIGNLGLHVDAGNSFSYSANLSGTMGLAKSGGGVLTISGNNSNSGTIILAGGQLNVNSATALGTGPMVINSSTTLDNTSGGAIVNSNNNPISWNGTFTYAGSNDLNLGTGTVTAGGSRTAIVKGGTLTMGPITSTNPVVKQGAGTLALLSSSNVYTDSTISGGVLTLGSTGALGSAGIGLSNGELRIDGSSAAARAMTAGALSIGAGRDSITLNADPSQPISLTVSSIGARGAYSTHLYRGTNLGSTPGNGVANIFISSAPTPSSTVATGTTFAAVGSGALGTTQAAVLRGSLADTSATGNGSGFATYDPAKGIRVLDSSTEQLTVASGAAYTASAAGDNVRISNTSMSITGKQTNTLHLSNTAAGTMTVTNSGTALTPSNGLLFTGNNPIDLVGGTMTQPGTGVDLVIQSTNTAGVNIGIPGTTMNINFSGSGQRDLVFGGSGAITLNGNVSNIASNGGYAINGPGTVTLNGAMGVSSNGFQIYGGTFKLGPSYSMSSSRPFKVAHGATIDMNGVSVSNVERLEDLNGAGGVITNSSATVATLTLSQGSNVTGNRNFTGVITGNINLARNAVTGVTGKQTLSGQNTYTGSTIIASGTLENGVHNALPTSTALVINGGGATASTYHLNGLNQTVGSLAGTGGTIMNTVAGTTSTLTVSGAASTSYAGVIADGGGTTALVKSGSGALALSGNNTYTGATTVSGGTLRVNGSINSAVSVAGGATLGGGGSITGPVTVASGGIISPGASIGTLSLASLNISSGTQTLDFEIGASTGESDVLAITGSDALLIGATPGSKTINLTSSSGGSVQNGTYTLIDYNGSPLASISQFTLGTLPLRVTAPGGLIHNTGDTSIQVTLNADAPKWVGNVNSTWDINSTANWKLITAGTATNYLQPGAVGDFVTFDDTAVNGNVNLANSTFTPAGIAVNNSSLTYSFGGSGTISGATGLTKQGSGTLILGNAGGASYTGLTSVEGGVLVLNTNMSTTGATSILAGATMQIGTGGTTGSIGSGAITNDGTISVLHSGNVTIAGTLGGTGSLTQSGGGTVSLTGNASAFTGNVAVTSSTLKMGHATGIGSANLNLSNATLTQSASATVYNNATTAGAFSKINLTGTNTIDTSGLNMSLGAELIGDSTTTIIRNGTGTLSLGVTGNAAFTNGTFSGTLINNTGNLHLASRNSGSAAAKFIFNGGTVTLGNAGGTMNLGYIEGSAPISGTAGNVRLRVGDYSNATASFTSTYSGNIVGSTLGFAKFGTGTLILSGQNQFAGVDGVTFPDGYAGFNVVVGGGALVAGSSTNGAASGPFGGSDAGVLLGNRDFLSDAWVLIDGAFSVTNNLTVSGGITASSGYTLTLGGKSNNTGTFGGSISLQNNVTVTQAATTGSNALYLTGAISGTNAGRGPAPSDVSDNNDGTQEIILAGPGAISVTGNISNGGGVVSVASSGGSSRLSGTNDYTGMTTVTGGVLTLTPSASGPVLTGAGAVLNGGKLVMEYSGSSPKDVIVPDLQANAASGFQAGRVHTTNAVDATKAIGWLDDGSKFTVRYTYAGDADLDGKVNTIDFNYLAGNFGKTSGGIWAEGDFNYDGQVNSLDFNALTGTYGSAPLGSSVPAAPLGSVVPEPASLSVVAIGVMGMMSRRRRR